MLTAQKRKFALALMSGMSKKDAAIDAGYSDKSARSKGSQLSKDSEVIAFIERKKNEKVEVDDIPECRRIVNNPTVNTAQESHAISAPVAGWVDDPLEFLKTIMNDDKKEIEVRKDAAKAMLPYIHPKKGEGGKKDAKLGAAKAAHSKFSGMAPPKLVVNNKG